ncbi:MAG: transglutaminase domain-containing protein [Eubacterium sp.]
MKKGEILEGIGKKAVIGMLAFTTAFCFMVPAMTNQTYAKTRHPSKSVRDVKRKSAAPGVISNVKFTDQDNGCTVIRWKNASRARKYKVYFKVDNAEYWDRATETKDCPAEIVRTGYDHTLHIKVKAYNGSKAGKMSRTYSFHTRPLYDYATGTPSTLTLKVGETKKITYKTVRGWKRSTPRFDYEDESVNPESIATVTGNGTVTGLSEGTFTVCNYSSGKTPKIKVVVTSGNSTNGNSSFTNESEDSTSDSGKSAGGNNNSSANGNNGSGTVTPTDPSGSNSGNSADPGSGGNTSGNSSSSTVKPSAPVTPADSTDAELRAKVQEIKNEAGIKDNMSDIMKAKLAADWLCDHADYDHDYDSKTDAQMETEVSCRYVLLADNPKTVCSGYARAYNYILTQLGVPVRNIAYAAGDHEWNQIEVNGSWYNIDVTWMDLEPSSMHTHYRDFMKSYTAMVNQEGATWKVKPHAYYDDPTLVQYRSDDTRYDNYTEEQWENYRG